tara:strand:- start:393 stop:938 length:546 start_codon:yes stop_codon:yes gene_type:complete
MTTNITDLPGGNSNQPNIQLHTREKPQKKPSLNSINEMVSGLQKAASNNMTRLPERDIPQNPERITHDPEIQPNFVPPPPPNPHYIEDEMDYEYMMRRNANEKKEKEQMQTLYDELQTPLIVSVLYFLFSLPFINKTLLKFVPTLFKDDGHPKFTGYLFKTLLFGITVFLSDKILNTVSEF